MSDISESNSIASNGSYKRRLAQIDDTIEHLSQEVNSLNNFMCKTEFECSLMTVRMKREKLKALSAIARAQAIMADMQVRVAEGELYTDVEKLKNFKKMRLDNEGANQRHTCQVPARTSTASVSVQTTGTIYEKKSRKHGSSRKSPVGTSSLRKSPIDISSEKTILIPSIFENASCTETSQLSPSVFSQGIFEKMPSKRSGSEVSLSSSVKAEFNDPFTQTQKEATKISPAKKHKSDKKGDGKSKSRSQSSSQKITSKQTQSAPKTVADLRKTVEKKSSTSSTIVPARHTNLPEIISRPSTSSMPPVFSVNSISQPNLQHNAQDARPFGILSFYGSQP
ncbi:hypothetical protein PYW08_012677 [Mythimna loreyi]|uniref:Uncharacterized protein n=1 Tax=Mythimna loreyi TaxID=667449 RepID=A0ACC2Q112_9NEOP|nr:hypothetical protein PYW08_012677 [Mythimna loreyi]